MSYVIQNFSKFNQHTAVTPRLKIFLSLHSINFFLFFFKFNNFSWSTFHFSLFFNFFFKKGLTIFFYNLLLHLSANYSNKLTLTASYWNFKLLDEFLEKKRKITFSLRVNSFFFYNLYLLSVKIINIKITKTYFKSIFFFFIFFLSELWLQFHTHLSFYLNFFFIKNNFKIYKFYNGYFLRVYNF